MQAEDQPRQSLILSLLPTPVQEITTESDEFSDQPPIQKIPKYIKILQEIEKEAEKILGSKKLKLFFQSLYGPLETTEDDLNELRCMLRAVADISGNDGETNSLEEQVFRNEQLRRSNDYSMEQLRKAKRIFDECQKHDMELFGISRVNTTSKNMIQNFQKINRDLVIGKEAMANPSIDQIALKSMGQHKALAEGDLEKFNSFRENKFTDQQILQYLENQIENELSDLDKFSEDLGIDPYRFRDKEFQADFGIDFSGMDDDEKMPDLLDTFPNSIVKPNPQGQYLEKLKLKMYDELENIDHIIKSSEDNIKLTKSHYLLHLRTVYHEKVVALKQQRDIFRDQLSKMSRAHTLQMRNIENFALSIAAEMFKKKAQQVRVVFSKECSHLVSEYEKIHRVMKFFEKSFKELQKLLSTQEQELSDQNLYMSELKRRKRKFQLKKKEIEPYLSEIQGERFKKIPVKEFMKKEFDFYGLGIRLGQQEREKILKNIMFKYQEKEIQNYKDNWKVARQEVTTLNIMMEQSQAAEFKVKNENAQLLIDLENEKQLHAKNLEIKDNLHAAEIAKRKLEYQQLVKDYMEYKQFVEAENQVSMEIIIKQKVICQDVEKLKEDNNLLYSIIKYPHLCKDFHLKVKEAACLEYQGQMNILQDIYKENYKDGQLPVIPVIDEKTKREMMREKRRGKTSPSFLDAITTNPNQKPVSGKSSQIGKDEFQTPFNPLMLQQLQQIQQQQMQLGTPLTPNQMVQLSQQMQIQQQQIQTQFPYLDSNNMTPQMLSQFSQSVNLQQPQFYPQGPNLQMFQTPQEKSGEIMTEDVKQYLGELLSGQKLNSTQLMSNNNMLSTTTRLMTSQGTVDYGLEPMYRSTIDWNIQSGIISTEKPFQMHSQLESQFSKQKNKLLSKANKILTVPSTRSGRRANLNLDAVARALQAQQEDSTRPLLVINQIGDKRIIKRNLMNQSLQNPHLKWNEMMGDEKPSKNLEKIPISGNKRFLELHLLKKHKRDQSIIKSPDTINEIHTALPKSKRYHSINIDNLNKRSKQFSLNERTTRNNYPEAITEKEIKERFLTHRKKLQSLKTNQSIDLGERTTTVKDTSLEISPNKVERKQSLGIIFDEIEIMNLMKPQL
ncbi:UNKNOWN [Stylonychia lemnae]|uniref:Uncharacterized protein n=1 Tax=Stylonychia lemnae TaxID=5949 RepID=A0A077ZSK0_STYLE|nr:UNKNOWN [Stylonychia lemnae]|eukprot:CDW71456.1 UNKNOWN [Stylonychia lemnae]